VLYIYIYIYIYIYSYTHHALVCLVLSHANNRLRVAMVSASFPKISATEILLTGRNDPLLELDIVQGSLIWFFSWYFAWLLACSYHILRIFILYMYVMISYCPLYGMVIYRNTCIVNVYYWYVLNLCSRDRKFSCSHKKLFYVL